MAKNRGKLDQDLQQREKTELIATIKLMLQQQPELVWVLQKRRLRKNFARTERLEERKAHL